MTPGGLEIVRIQRGKRMRPHSLIHAVQELCGDMEAETTDPVKGEGSAWVLGSHFCLQGEVLMFLAAVRSLLCLAPSVFDRILHL